VLVIILLRTKKVDLVYFPFWSFILFFDLFSYFLFLEPRVRVRVTIGHGHKSQDIMEGNKRF